MDNGKIKELVEESKKKNKEAFTELFDFYYDKILNYVFKRTLNADYTKDITSNTFIKVLKYIDGFEWRGGENSFTSWVYKIATNEINQYFRKQNRYRLIIDEEEFNELGDDGYAVKEIEQRLENEEYLLILNKAINQLKPIYRDILHLRYFEELSYDEISDILDKNETTLRVYAKRALEDLRAILKEDAHLFLEEK